MSKNTVGLLSVTAIGIGSIVGSGWLFASYYAAKIAGGGAIFAWIIAAVFVGVMGLALAEIATMYPQRGLFSRLLALSHNRDMGYVTGLSNWLGILIIVPSEALATVQYLSSSFKEVTPYVFVGGNLTLIGIACVAVLMLFYLLMNYWGVRLLSKFNNISTAIKLIIPTITAVAIILCAFHTSNFTAYHHQLLPYHVSSIFVAIVSGGIFYAFYGFQIIVTFAAELRNPKRNIPLAIGSCILICGLLYLLLQVAFIGALTPKELAHGWHHLQFNAPLVQLTSMLGLNVITVVLYLDAAISPSATAIIYAGAGARSLTAMSQEGQMPSFFDRVCNQYNFSRRSLVFTIVVSFLLVLFFRNWHAIVMLVTTFQLLSCIAIPIALTGLRKTRADVERPFRLPCGRLVSLLIFAVLSFFLIKVHYTDLLVALVLHLVFFAIYAFVNQKHSFSGALRVFASASSVFIYMVVLSIIAYVNEHCHLCGAYQWDFDGVSVLALLVVYWILLKQKAYVK